METKALKKQMGAAIAMVLVAAIALAASTYAWFVNNNKVDATTSTITAQSNAPFLMIKKDTDQTLKDTSISYTDVANAKLYPAQVVKAEGDNSTDPSFVSAYGSDAAKADELTGSRFTVGDAAAAVTGEYAISETFQIGTSDAKAGSFKDLKVQSVEVASTAATNGLDGAIRVLLVCGDNWAVYKANTAGENAAQLDKYDDGTTVITCTATNNVLSNTIEAGKTVEVKAYVFYDGSNENVKTNNITALKDCNLKLTFTATPVSTVDTAKNTTGN